MVPPRLTHVRMALFNPCQPLGETKSVPYPGIYSYTLATTGSCRPLLG